MSMELMEEFLISTGKKSAIKYELKKERQEFSQIASVIQEQIEIVKNGWGYSQIEVFSDAAFLQPKQFYFGLSDRSGTNACRAQFWPDHLKKRKLEESL